MLSRVSLGIVAVFGSLMVGYCVYFDRKRRSAPDFRKRLQVKRKRQRQAAKSSGLPFGNLTTPDEIQRAFLQEIQLGERLLSEGSITEGVEHMCYAVVLCSQPSQLMSVLRQTIPPEIFARMIEKMPEIQARFLGATRAAGVTRITDEDVE